MTIECALFGSLIRDAEAKTSKAGKQYLRLNLRVENGEAAQFINTTVFDADAIQTAEQKVDHPNCLPLPVLARPNVRDARERAKQIMRLDVVPKDAGCDPAGDQRLYGNVEAVRGFAVDGFRPADQCVHRRRHIVLGVEKLHE